MRFEPEIANLEVKHKQQTYRTRIASVVIGHGRRMFNAWCDRTVLYCFSQILMMS